MTAPGMHDIDAWSLRKSPKQPYLKGDLFDEKCGNDC